MLRPLLIAAALPLCIAAAPDSQEGVVAYALSPELVGGDLLALRVELQFRAEPSGVTILDLPDRWAGRDGAWRNLRDMEVLGATQVSFPDPAHRRIESEPRATLRVRYRVVSDIDHEPSQADAQPFFPWIRPTWFYATGPAVFATPHGRTSASATFDWVDAPSDFAFASDLEHLGGAHRRARRPGTVEDVQDSVMIGGRDVDVIAAGQAGAPIRVAVRRGDYGFDVAAFAHETVLAMRQTQAFWGGGGEPFLVALGPLGSGGAASVNGSNHGDSFGMAVSGGVSLAQLKLTLAHEYFHTWNPRLLGGHAPEEAEEAWFGEGFTDFYARRLALRAGIIDSETFVEVWNAQLLAYASSPVRTAPNSRVVRDFWRDDDVGRLPYQRGAMLAALWNTRLLHLSAGRISLDEVLRAQREATVSSASTTAAALFVSTALRFGLDVRADVFRYVDGGDFISLPEDAFGSCAEVITENRPTYDLGFDPEATVRHGMIISGVAPGSRAHAAGLRNGMKLLRRTAGAPNDALTPTAFLVEDRGVRRTIHYLAEGADRVRVQQIRIRTPMSGQCVRSLSQ